MKFDDPPSSFVVKKEEEVAAPGELCEVAGEQVTCWVGFATRVICPKKCLQIRSQVLLSRGELKGAVDEAAKSATAVYSRRVPSKVLAQIQKKHPHWLPALYNPVGPFSAKFILLKNFYLEVPPQDKSKPVSIVYFFHDVDHLIEGKINWSFWDTLTGESLHDSVSPYKIFEKPYENFPCLVPIGKNFDDIVLFGLAAGPSDAGGCCGPYSLKELKSKGPIKIEAEKKEDFGLHSLCGTSIDPETGKYNPKQIYDRSNIHRQKK